MTGTYETCTRKKTLHKNCASFFSCRRQKLAQELCNHFATDNILAQFLRKFFVGSCYFILFYFIANERTAMNRDNDCMRQLAMYDRTSMYIR